MKKFCIITPDRGDRPELMAHCLFQMERQTLKPGDHYIINYAPKSDKPDLIQRIKDGLFLAKNGGYDIVFIIENDDYYPDNYLENMMDAFTTTPEIEAVGVFETLYYHILSQKYKLHCHPERSSLFCTGFKISALEGFEWPENTEVFIDLALWSHFKRYACLTIGKVYMPIGIKHGIGLCGGNGHNSKAPYYDMQDTNFEKLAKLVRPESLTFYKELIMKNEELIMKNEELKLKLIREAENLIGFRKFNVSKKSTEKELDEVLSFINTAYHELETSIIPKINNYTID